MKTATRKKKKNSCKYCGKDKTGALLHALMVYRQISNAADRVQNLVIPRRRACNSKPMPRLETLEYKIIETRCNWHNFVLMLADYNKDLVDEIVSSFDMNEDYSNYYYHVLSTLEKYGYRQDWNG